MAAEVSRPKKKDELGELMAVANIAQGGARMMAGDVSGALSVAQGAQSLDQQQQGGSQGIAAAERRLQPQTQQLPQAQDPLQAVQEAQVAVANLPPEQQKQFAPALQMGSAALRRQQGGVA